MSRLICLALLISASSVTALADTITYGSFGTLGTSSAMTSGSPTLGHTYVVQSSLTTIGASSAPAGFFVTVTTGTMISGSMCPPGTVDLCFTGGTIVISNGTTTLFSDTFAGGTLTRTFITVGGKKIPVINIFAADDGATTQLQVDGNVSGTTTVVVAPEPGTLGWLGTGLIGVAGIVSRWCRRSARA